LERRQLDFNFSTTCDDLLFSYEFGVDRKCITDEKLGTSRDSQSVLSKYSMTSGLETSLPVLYFLISFFHFFFFFFSLFFLSFFLSFFLCFFFFFVSFFYFFLSLSLFSFLYC